jgi:hypothetical protein
MVTQAYNPSPWEAEALDPEFKASLATYVHTKATYWRPNLKTKQNVYNNPTICSVIKKKNKLRIQLVLTL